MARRDGLQLMQTIASFENEACKTAGLFATLGEKFKPQHNETILLLQYCKL